MTSGDLETGRCLGLHGSPGNKPLGYPLVMADSLLLKMAIEIMDLPIDSMVTFHSYVTVYQRVSMVIPAKISKKQW